MPNHRSRRAGTASAPYVAAADPVAFSPDVLVELGFTDRERAQKAIEDGRLAGVPPERVLVDQSEEGAAPLEIVDLRESVEDAPVITLVHSIIAQAAERCASDIHFEPQADENGRSGFELRVRMRIDGVLTEVRSEIRGC